MQLRIDRNQTATGFFMTNKTRNTTQAALAAKAIKAEIKKQFPNISVKASSKNYSGGSSVNIKVIDQPPHIFKAIESIAEKYEYGHFDGMNDIYEYSNTRDDLPQAKYVFVVNYKSDEMRSALIEFVKSNFVADDPAITGWQIEQTAHCFFTGAYEGFWKNDITA